VEGHGGTRLSVRGWRANCDTISIERVPLLAYWRAESIPWKCPGYSQILPNDEKVCSVAGNRRKNLVCRCLADNQQIVEGGDWSGGGNDSAKDICWGRKVRSRTPLPNHQVSIAAGGNCRSLR